MRTRLRYGVAAGILAATFSALGPVSAYAGQIGNAAPVSATQQKASASQQGQMVVQRHIHCIHHHFHKYCRVYR